MKYYEIIHRRQDGTEALVKLVIDPNDIAETTETAKWAGTWATDKIKVLRGGKGELHIREKIQQPKIAGFKYITVGDQKQLWMECTIRYHEELKIVCLRENYFVGYNYQMEVVWSVSSINAVSMKAGKELAWALSKYYDKFLADQATKKKDAR